MGEFVSDSVKACVQSLIISRYSVQFTHTQTRYTQYTHTHTHSHTEHQYTNAHARPRTHSRTVLLIMCPSSPNDTLPCPCSRNSLDYLQNEYHDMPWMAWAIVEVDCLRIHSRLDWASACICTVNWEGEVNRKLYLQFCNMRLDGNMQSYPSLPETAVTVAPMFSSGKVIGPRGVVRRKIIFLA